MAFTAKILSWRFRHLNIVGGVTGTQGPPLATPLVLQNPKHVMPFNCK